MRIDLRHIDGAVPQHLLNIADIHIRVQKACRKGVAEHMRRDVLFNGCQRGIFVYHPAHRLIGECFPGVIDKKIAAGQPFVTKAIVVFFQNMNDGLAADLDAAFFASLSVNQDGSVAQIYVVDFQ